MKLARGWLLRAARPALPTRVAQLTHPDAGGRGPDLGTGVRPYRGAGRAGRQDRDLAAGAGRDGRVLAEPLVSPRDLPSFDNSAVDGYAVTLADLDETRTLPVVGRIAAGAPNDGPLVPGTTTRIFNGGEAAAGRRHDLHAGGCRRLGRSRGVRRWAMARRQPAPTRGGHRARRGGSTRGGVACGRRTSRLPPPSGSKP